MRPLRIGIVCPYSLDVPGGVQNHIQDLARTFIDRGHSVSVLAPTDLPPDQLPAYVVSAGKAVAVPYNGAVGRVSFGPAAAARTKRWLEANRFDVVHLHEPGTPSLGLLCLGFVQEVGVPVVATFHMSADRSRILSMTAGLVRPRLERISARIAVSELARDTHVRHLGGEPVIIPNGVDIGRFARAVPDESLRGVEATVCFIGRIEEPRKGLSVLLDGFARIAGDRPGVRLNVIGGGDIDEVRSRIPEPVREQVHFLGPVDDDTKMTALRSADVYVAPNTGGESFGIVLVEAMAAGTTVLASDLPAFMRVLEGGRLGATFRSTDSEDLARELGELLDNPERCRRLTELAAEGVWRYDWSTVALEIERVYETVVGR